MKKTKLIFAFFCCSTLAIAQVGIQASGVLSNASFTDDTVDQVDKGYTAGFGLGIYADLALSENFSLRPSLNFMQKGVRIESEAIEDGTVFSQDLKAKLNYLELPVLVTYRWGGSDGKLFFGLGPSVGYGLSGKLKGDLRIEGEDLNETVALDIDAFKDEEDDGAGLKRFDIGAMGLIGYQLTTAISVQLNYLHGLSNLANTAESNDNAYRNRNLMFTLGYAF